MEARWGGQPLALHGGKPGAILALLLLRGGREVKREWLAETLWPDGAGGEGLVNLRQRLADLRRQLGPAAGRLVAPSSRTLRFDADEHEVDLLAFDRAIARGDVAALQRAVALYAGPLLEDYAEFWAEGEREARQDAFLDALVTLAGHALADGSAATAIEFLRRGAGVDRFHQSLHRLLMQAYAREEDWEAALQVYADLRRALLSLHNAEPEPETTRLYQEIRLKARRPIAATPVRAATEPPPCRIPYPLTPLIGREAELHEIGARLLSARLVTLTGLGGAGKTRLAQEAGRDLIGTLPGGAWFVDLAGVTEPARIDHAVAETLELRGVGYSLGEAGWKDQLREHLRGRHLLLILDNCEHLLSGCRDLAQRLLSECPHVRILATSRQPLQLIGETVVPVSPLPLAPEDVNDSVAAASPASRLFAERAAQPDALLKERLRCHPVAPVPRQQCEVVKRGGDSPAILKAAPGGKTGSVERIGLLESTEALRYDAKIPQGARFGDPISGLAGRVQARLKQPSRLRQIAGVFRCERRHPECASKPAPVVHPLPHRPRRITMPSRGFVVALVYRQQRGPAHGAGAIGCVAPEQVVRTACPHAAVPRFGTLSGSKVCGRGIWLARGR